MYCGLFGAIWDRMRKSKTKSLKARKIGRKKKDARKLKIDREYFIQI